MLFRSVSADVVVPSHALPQTLNRYVYVTNNPVSYRDPTGHSPNPALGAAVLAGQLVEWFVNSSVVGPFATLPSGVADRVVGNNPHLSPEEADAIHDWVDSQGDDTDSNVVFVFGRSRTLGSIMYYHPVLGQSELLTVTHNYIIAVGVGGTAYAGGNPSNGASPSSPGNFGTLLISAGLYDSDIAGRDFTDRPSDTELAGVLSVGLEEVQRELESLAASVNSRGVPYAAIPAPPYGNSNTFYRSGLESMGLPVPDLQGWAPGAQYSLAPMQSISGATHGF